METDSPLIRTTQKGDVTEHVCEVPEPINVRVVRLDVMPGNEQRYRVFIGEDEDQDEGRLLVSTIPHYQKQKLHSSSATYLLQRGWVAILTESTTGFNVDIGFARCPDYYSVKAPADTWYAAFLSGPVAYTYGAANNETGQTREYTVDMPDETTILKLFALQHKLSFEHVLGLVRTSLSRRQSIKMK